MGDYRLRIYQIEQEKPVDLAVLPEHARAAFNDLIDRSIIPIGAILLTDRQDGRYLFLKVLHDSYDVVPEGSEIPTESVGLR